MILIFLSKQASKQTQLTEQRSNLWVRHLQSVNLSPCCGFVSSSSIMTKLYFYPRSTLISIAAIFLFNFMLKSFRYRTVGQYSWPCPGVSELNSIHGFLMQEERKANSPPLPFRSFLKSWSRGLYLQFLS